MTRATIHQPDFMPWFGFFNKLAKADTWIVLDHVENNPRDASFWGRRVRILVNGQPSWLAVSLCRPAVAGVIGVPIREMTINTDSAPDAAEKCIKTVRMAYSAAPFYKRYASLVDNYFTDPDRSLMNRNMRFIADVCRELGIATRIVLSSTLQPKARSTELLVELLKKAGADVYLCGGGAQGYQRDELFAASGIGLEYNSFEHPVYQQLRASDFVSGLSILDMLFCIPLDQVTEWVHHS